MPVTRDDVVHDRIRQRAHERPGEELVLLDDAEFEASRQQILREFEAHDEFWVFGYGSLIWNPTFLFADQRAAALMGYARRFCIWATSGRGTVDQPGLWLGLDHGASCSGIAWRLHDDQRDYESLMLWRREMVSGSYLPRVLPVNIDGRDRPTLCLLANRHHDRYAGELSEKDIVRCIATGEGHLGTSREYLFNLVEHLKQEGVPDAELEALAAHVDQYGTTEHG